MDEIKKVFERFNNKYNNHNEVYLYPGYQKDLQAILNFVKQALIKAEEFNEEK